MMTDRAGRAASVVGYRFPQDDRAAVDHGQRGDLAHPRPRPYPPAVAAPAGDPRRQLVERSLGSPGLTRPNRS